MVERLDDVCRHLNIEVGVFDVFEFEPMSASCAWHNLHNAASARPRHHIAAELRFHPAYGSQQAPVDAVVLAVTAEIDVEIGNYAVLCRDDGFGIGETCGQSARFAHLEVATKHLLIGSAAFGEFAPCRDAVGKRLVVFSYSPRSALREAYLQVDVDIAIISLIDERYVAINYGKRNLAFSHTLYQVLRCDGVFV